MVTLDGTTTTTSPVQYQYIVTGGSTDSTITTTSSIINPSWYTGTSATGSSTLDWTWNDNSTSTTGGWTGNNVITFDTYSPTFAIENGNFTVSRPDVWAWDKKAAARARWQQQISGGAPRQRHADAADFTKVSQSEMVALQLMRKMLAPDAWKRYLRHGFIVVRGKTGLEYQIIRGRDHIRVFKQGTKVAELCIYVADRKVPRTDEVITKKVMLECDELSVWHKANVYPRGAMISRQPSEQDLIALAA